MKTRINLAAALLELGRRADKAAAEHGRLLAESELLLAGAAQLDPTHAKVVPLVFCAL